jgi:trk system potassium uptake protein TrkH
VNTQARARRIGPPQTLAVDLRGAANVVATLLLYLSPAALVPAVVAPFFDGSPWPYVAATAVTAAVAFATERLTRGEHRIGTREGFLIVAATWLFAAAFGALPYLFSGEPQLDRPLDAYFEAMSGFTTTGASVLVDIEALSRPLLLWRQLTQWLGGMGIIVLALAVLPRLRVGGRQLLDMELAGPGTEDLSSRIRDTARRLWLLYVALTAVVFLVFLGLGLTGLDEEMTFFDAVAHALSTAPTGGFSPRQESVGAFAPVTQWVVAFFLVVGAMNFALLYRGVVRRRPRVVTRDEEFRLYLALLAVGAVVLVLELFRAGLFGTEETLRHGVFQAVSIMTASGFVSTDYELWPVLTTMTLIGLMFVGGSAGSTSGSVKVIRHLLLGKILRRELDQTVHPELVQPVRLNGVAVDERTLRAVTSFILLYVGFFVVGATLLAVDAAAGGPQLDVVHAIAAAAAALGNVGPAFGVAGPTGGYEPFGDFSTVVLVVLMWLGRLELIPIAVLVTRHYWRSH